MKKSSWVVAKVPEIKMNSEGMDVQQSLRLFVIGQEGTPAGLFSKSSKQSQVE